MAYNTYKKTMRLGLKLRLCSVVLLHSVQHCETFVPAVRAPSRAHLRLEGASSALQLKMRVREEGHAPPATRTRRAHLAGWYALVLGVLGGSAEPACAEKRKRPSGGLVGENPNAAQDLFTGTRAYSHMHTRSRARIRNATIHTHTHT